WPASGSSSRVIRRNTVVLPAPFGPTRPIFSPRFTAAEASRNRICAPWRLEMASMRIMRWGAVAQAITPVERAGRGLDFRRNAGNRCSPTEPAPTCRYSGVLGDFTRCQITVFDGSWPLQPLVRQRMIAVGEDRTWEGAVPKAV